VKLVGRIPVAPLDDARLSKIERAVVIGAERPVSGHPASWPRLDGVVVAATAAVMAGAIGWLLRDVPVAAPVVAEPAAIRVETTPARAVLDLGDARIESDPETVFAVTRPAGGVLVALSRGKLELEVGKRGARPPLIVRAGDTEVIVVGTRFSVDYGDGHGEVAVRVAEGIVRVVHDGEAIRIAAGEAWQTGGRQIAIADASTRDRPRGDQAARPGATLRVPSGTPGRHDRQPVAPPAPASASRATTRPGPAPTQVRPPRGVAPRGPARPGDPLSELRAAIRTQPVEPALALTEPDPAAAVGRYYDIAAHQSGDAASQAFYSVAVVRYLRLGQRVEALQALDAYVRRFPGGKEYRAALWLRVRILCVDKIDDRCRAAAYTYLHEAGDGPAARLAELITLAE
jgi:hypothetical protein